MTCSGKRAWGRIVFIWGPIVLLSLGWNASAQTMGDAMDVGRDFQDMGSVYYMASQAVSFDPADGSGKLRWARYRRQLSLSFNKLDHGFAPASSSDFPATEYDESPELPFSITFVSPRTVRVRFSARSRPLPNRSSLMLVTDPPRDDSWKAQEEDGRVVFRGPHGSLRLVRDPWSIELLDASGHRLTRTLSVGEVRSFVQPVPFSMVRRRSDLGRSFAATFELAHDEKIFGVGESFTRLNKRGQKMLVYTRDGMGTQSERMYKPIPFFLSSAGYAMFVHTSAPLTFDFGKTFDQFNTIYSGDEVLDLFIFLGDPKQVLAEYTALTGRSPVPPLWSFGLWMSRITYKSEAEVRRVAAQLREHRIPCDVIHIDTGWFETDWQCDYRFSPSRFPNAAGMISDLAEQGLHVSLWQLPYFTSKNPLFNEIVQSGYAVRNASGRLPAEDAILDFSNPQAVEWYQQKLAGLLKLGVSAIKVDFGEDAPFDGIYASGASGYYEHNLYPLRYNRAAAEITRQITGESIIWARSAWAGSQRYPLHWGGDAENTDSAMAATLRAGLSFGLSGFTFWSHDVGGFVNTPPRDLYRRWMGFGILTSHMRLHGAPPREPWEFDEELTDDFRRGLELRYSLLPYIWAQAHDSSKRGLPMLRALFVEFPKDPGAWLVEDEYLLGSDLLVAPLFSPSNKRQVYLPPGAWTDYQSGAVYAGSGWHELEAGAIPVILLVRDHCLIPRIAPALTTSELDWSRVELRVFSTDGQSAQGLFALPQGDLQQLTVESDGKGWVLKDDPLAGRLQWIMVGSK